MVGWLALPGCLSLLFIFVAKRRDFVAEFHVTECKLKMFSAVQLCRSFSLFALL